MQEPAIDRTLARWPRLGYPPKSPHVRWVTALALLAATGLADHAIAADLLERDAIIEKLLPAPGEPKLRALMILPSIDLDVKFEFNSDRLTPEATRQLSELGAALSADVLKSYRFEIAGHTDTIGSSEFNQRLSERRAASVRDFMIERFGIEPGRLAPIGWGFSKLKNPQDPTSGENRRVEIVNLGT